MEILDEKAGGAGGTGASRDKKPAIASPLPFFISSINPRITEKLRLSIEKTAHILQSSQTLEYIQMMLIDPFLKYIFNRIFPYILIGICLFLALFIFVVSSFIIILLRGRGDNLYGATNLRGCPYCSSG
jgi:hypothetical protein